MKKLSLYICTVCIVSFIFSNGCSSSEQSFLVRKPVGENIPPGSAVVLCQLNGFEDKGDFYLLDVKIKSVIGYGSATDEITPNTDLKLQLGKKLTELKSFKNGTEFELEIKQPKTGMESERNTLWTVSQLIK